MTTTINIRRQPVSRRARQTGRLVMVAHAIDCSLEHAPEFGLVWYTICEDHGSCIGHATRRLADWHASDPVGWCDECRESVGS